MEKGEIMMNRRGGRRGGESSASEGHEHRWTERGAVAVEFALVLPLLVLLVFGIYEFGRGYNAKVTMTHAAREGVRDYVINQDTGQAATTAANAAVNLSGDASWSAVVTDSCDGTSGDTATLTVGYSTNYTIPLFNSGTWNLSESATMRCGG